MSERTNIVATHASETDELDGVDLSLTVELIVVFVLLLIAPFLP